MGLAMFFIYLTCGVLLPTGKVLAQSPTSTSGARASTQKTRPDAADMWRLWDQWRNIATNRYCVNIITEYL